MVIGSSLPVASPFTRPNKFVRQGQGQSQSGQDAAWTTSTSISGASSDSAALGGAYRPTQTQAFLAGSPGTAGSPSSASASAPSASVNAVNAQISRDPYKPVGVNMAQHVFTDGSQPQHLIPGVMEFDPAQLPAPPSGAQGQSGGAAGQTDGDDKPWRRPGADLTAWFNYGAFFQLLYSISICPYRSLSHSLSHSLFSLILFQASTKRAGVCTHSDNSTCGNSAVLPRGFASLIRRHRRTLVPPLRLHRLLRRMRRVWVPEGATRHSSSRLAPHQVALAVCISHLSFSHIYHSSSVEQVRSGRVDR